MTIRAVIVDDGGRRCGSIGLTNVRNRLRGLYGGQASLDVANVDGCGVRVTISQPWRESPASASGDRKSTRLNSSHRP